MCQTVIHIKKDKLPNTLPEAGSPARSDPEGGLGEAQGKAGEVGRSDVAVRALASSACCGLHAASLPAPGMRCKVGRYALLVVSGRKGLEGHSYCFGTDYKSNRKAFH